MPQIGFVCPNGKKVSFEECLSGKGCSKEEECCHVSIRKKAAEYREWKGVPSVTQLQNPTYLSFLEITQDYYIRPQDSTFALFGTAVHSLLEQDMERIASKLGFTGLPDWYMEDDEELIDFKVSSWYTMQPTIDKWIMQVNAYRLLLQEIGKKVKRMRIQIICRDAKLTRDQQYTKWIEVPFLDDSVVLEYFSSKRIALLDALDKNELPNEVCTDEDRWVNSKTGVATRCKYYCPVRGICPSYNVIF